MLILVSVWNSYSTHDWHVQIYLYPRFVVRIVRYTCHLPSFVSLGVDFLFCMGWRSGCLTILSCCSRGAPNHRQMSHGCSGRRVGHAVTAGPAPPVASSHHPDRRRGPTRAAPLHAYDERGLVELWLGRLWKAPLKMRGLYGFRLLMPYRGHLTDRGRQSTLFFNSARTGTRAWRWVAWLRWGRVTAGRLEVERCLHSFSWASPCHPFAFGEPSISCAWK
jgi:hypothetical protein